MTDASEHARELGRIKTPKKAEASRRNAEKARQAAMSPEARENRRLAQQARRQREREELEREVAARIAEAERAAQEEQP